MNTPGAAAPRPARRRRAWRWLRWLLLAAGLALLSAGAAIGDGVLLAIGLTMAAVAVQLLSRPEGPTDRQGR